MKIELRKAERKMAKLRIGVSAPSGGGKTYSALLIAKGLVGDWKKIALIDTENGSGELYSELGEYNIITLEAPFSPEIYAEAIKACEDAGMEAIVIDSATHEWDGKGGCLEIVDSLGGRYQDWAKVTPRHRGFLEAILASSAHVITTTRRKQDYAMNQDQSGKVKVEKLGMKEVQREGFEYELTIAFDIDIKHNTVASKDRTGLFMDKPDFVITEETGVTLKEWAESGKDERIEKKEKINKLLVKLGKKASKKTDDFLNKQTINGLNNYISIYEKEILEVEKKKELEKKPASDQQKNDIRKTIADNGLNEEWVEKKVGIKIDEMTIKQVGEIDNMISDYVEEKMKESMP